MTPNLPQSNRSTYVRVAQLGRRHAVQGGDSVGSNPTSDTQTGRREPSMPPRPGEVEPGGTLAEPGHAPAHAAGRDLDCPKAEWCRRPREGKMSVRVRPGAWGCSSEGKSAALARRRMGFESPLLHKVVLDEGGRGVPAPR